MSLSTVIKFENLDPELQEEWLQMKKKVEALGQRLPSIENSVKDLSVQADLDDIRKDFDEAFLKVFESSGYTSVVSVMAEKKRVTLFKGMMARLWLKVGEKVARTNRQARLGSL